MELYDSHSVQCNEYKKVQRLQKTGILLLDVITGYCCSPLTKVKYTTSWKAGASHHGRQRCSSVRVRLCRSSEAALPFSGVCSFCSVTPVAAHPLGEVAIVILVVIHHKSRQEPEGHDSPAGVCCWFFSSLSFREPTQCCSTSSGPTAASLIRVDWRRRAWEQHWLTYWAFDWLAALLHSTIPQRQHYTASLRCL